MAKKFPVRKCIGCGEMKEKRELVRVLKCEEGIVVDTTGCKNGRGAYLCKSAQCFAQAVKNKGLERSLKTQIPKELYEQLGKELAGVEG